MTTKEIELSGMKYKLTDEKKRRISLAIIETQELLNKELSYSKDLQHKNTIAFYRKNIKMLTNLVS